MSKLTMTAIAVLLLAFVSCKKANEIKEEKILTTSPILPFFAQNPYWDIHRAGNSPDIYYQYSGNGINWSAPTKITTPIPHTTETGTSTIFAFDKLFVASKSNTTNTVHISYSTNGTSWTTIATPLQSSHVPALIHEVEIGGGPLTVYGNFNGNLVYTTSADGITWSAPSTVSVPGLAPGSLTGGLTGDHDRKGLTFIYFTQSNGQIGRIDLDVLGGINAFAFQSLPLSQLAEYEPDVAGGYITYKSRVSRSIIFGPVGGPVAPIPGTQVYAGPSITKDANSNRIVIKCRGSNNDIYYCVTDNFGASWTINKSGSKTNASPDVAHIYQY